MSISNWNTWCLSAALIVALLAPAACGEARQPSPPAEQPPPWQDYVPDESLYSADRDPEGAVEVSAGGADPRRVPADIVMVLLEEGGSRAEAERVAGEDGRRGLRWEDPVSPTGTRQHSDPRHRPH